MIFVKSVFTGILAAVFALVAWVGGQLALVFIWMQFEMRVRRDGGLGGATVGISDAGAVAVAAIGFAVGFYWMWRRSTRTAVTSGRT